MNFCQLRKEHSGLCDWRNLQKGALRNEKQPKRKHFLLNVPYPVIYRTPLKEGAWQTVWLTKLTKGRTKKRNTEASSSKAENRGEGKTPTTRNRKLHPRGGANATFFCLHALSTHAAFVRKRQLYTNKRGNKKTIQTIHRPYIQPCIPLIYRALWNV